MGVRGIRHLLEDVGWLDQSFSEAGLPSGNIWKEWNASDAFLGNNCSPPLEQIPPNARFLIDGNGLAFFLHSLAYIRYLQSLEIRSNGSSSNNNSGINANSNPVGTNKARRCPTTKEIMTDKIATTLALPCMLPLSILRAVTKEFVAELKSHIQEIKVFWDGPARRFKTDTDKQRHQERDRHESYQELYCNHGTLITAGKKKNFKYVYEWKEVFPFSKLFGTCVRHALMEEGDGMVEMIECYEEADSELAQQASGDDRAFVLGFDSDFYFYKDIQYIPLNQMVIQPSGFHAFVARRSDLARKLGFGDNDNRLIDLVLLMGNDYVDPFLFLDVPESIDLTKVQSMVYYLQCHEDFEATAKNKKGKSAVEFVRSLYNLHCIDSFPLDDEASVLEEKDDVLENEMEQARMLPHEMMVRDAILRNLRATLDRVGLDPRFPLTEEAILAFEISSKHTERDNIPPLATRPTYRDTKAAKCIELCIAQFYRTAPNSWLLRATPPEFLMSRIHFHAVLATFREQSTEVDAVQGEEPIQEEKTEPVVTAEPIRLPIDDHEERILENIRNHRVTIIHGETGCGKSSRVPVMLLRSPPPDGSLNKVRFFISQPRRIAAKALVERVRSCEPDLRDKFALRMGHGWREYETKDTQAHFVTTGYLVRLLANHPERFDNNTHLVIDEVHERSVDTDLLCLLCRRLMETNRTIRLVLMSATLATKMYRDYFGVPNDPIHVGVRRYPITEFFVEDLERFRLPETEQKAIRAIQKDNETKMCITAPSATQMKSTNALAARLATIVGEPGASVLIFVPGMGEIIAISECIESYHKVGIRYTCFPIHGDIPFEEQMDAFNVPAEDEVKIIIATNAAESSVTLPNVDHVICLGLCRQIIYNQTSHRQMLTSAWISKASATQRAGRTGRVRPGNVYRLYSRKAFDCYMEEFESGEMVRIPLDNVILMLKQILHEEIKPVFLDCLEPPALDTIDRSFQSLCYWNFITEPNDKADITPLGGFVSSLGIDLSLGSFVGLGIQFGVAAEAIEMAAMMSLPKTPFQMASPMWLSPGKFNRIASQTYSSKCNFDAGLYSEPMGLMNAIWEYSTIDASKKNSWIHKNNLAHKRWQQVISSRKSLRKRVADFLGIQEEKLEMQLPPSDMAHEKVLILRILKVWVFSDSILECSPSKLQLSQDGSVAISVKARSSVRLENRHLNGIFKHGSHPFSIVECNEVEQTGIFEEEGSFSFSNFVDEFEHRLLSYASEKNIEGTICYSDEALHLYLDKTKMAGKEKLLEFLESNANIRDRFAYDFTNKKRRGIQERASGIWTVVDTSSTDALFARRKEFLQIDLCIEDDGDFETTRDYIVREVLNCDLKSKMTWHFFTKKRSKKKKKKSSSSQPFWVTTIGECCKISSLDLEDLLGRKPLSVSTNTKNSEQSIILQHPPDSIQQEVGEFRESLFEDVPIGARILALLASSQCRGKKYVLKIPQDSENVNSEETYDFGMKEAEIDVSMRWRRFHSSKPVYVDGSVPSSAIHTTNVLYAVAANALDLQSGGMRVECMTLLPPNPLFVLLSHLSFGLEMSTSLTWSLALTEGEDEKSKSNKKVNKSYTWLVNRAKKISKLKNSESDRLILSPPPVTDNSSSRSLIWEEDDLKNRLEQAILFNRACSSMGEKLVCFPEMIRELCDLFDGVDGHSLSPWDSIDEEGLTAENLSKWRLERKSSTKEGDQRHSRQFPTSKNQQAAPPSVSNSSDSTINRGAQTKPSSKKKKMERHAIRHFDNELIASSKNWFAITLDTGEDMPTFPSTNILALVFQQFGQLSQPENVAGSNKYNFKVALNTANWGIACFKGKTDKSLYKACFVNESIIATPIFGRGKNKLPKWIKKNKWRPTTIELAKACVPPNINIPTMVESKDDGLLFESIEDALKMESAFWLNQQFCHAGKTWERHWYMHSMDQMINMLQTSKNN